LQQQKVTTPGMPTKQQREILCARWRQEGLDVDEIAHRFRMDYRVRALTAYRWANDLLQRQVVDAYSQRFLNGDKRLHPQRLSEYENWPPGELGGREPPLSMLSRFAAIYHTTTARPVAAISNEDNSEGRETQHPPLGAPGTTVSD